MTDVSMLCCVQAGLEPTHQIIKSAKEAGFSNVHDYLVHLVTGGWGCGVCMCVLGVVTARVGVGVRKGTQSHWERGAGSPDSPS